jgi:hypothetical protein
MFWGNLGKRQSNAKPPRRIYNYERIYNRKPCNAYLSIDRFRGGDKWMDQRATLQRVVQKFILAEAAQHPVGSISLYAVWTALIPVVAPTHWITAGYRSSANRLEREPIIQIPVSLGGLSTDQIIESIGGPLGFAVDSLIPPNRIDELTQRDRAVFGFTLLSALTLEARDLMRDRKL